MIKRRISYPWCGDDVKARFFLEFFLLAAIMNGVSSDYAHTHSYGIRSLTQVVNPDQLYQVNHTLKGQRNNGYSGAIYNENVLMRTAFDKMLRWIFDSEIDSGDQDGRRFKFKLGGGFVARRRLMFALLPIMYKMGVMTTMLSGLTILVLKGLTIGIILLVLAFGNYFAKLPKYSHQSAQPIHVHLHSPDGHKISSYPVHTLGPWDRTMEETNPSSYNLDSELESYRQKLIQYSADLLKYRPLVH